MYMYISNVHVHLSLVYSLSSEPTHTTPPYINTFGSGKFSGRGSWR